MVLKHVWHTITKLSKYQYIVFTQIDAEKETSDYTFDRVYGPDTKQIEIFETAARPLVKGAMDGYNGTLLCYGQTSSGKTFTMEVQFL